MDTKFNIPDSLIEELQAKRVVPFIGAGISRAIEKKDKDPSKSFAPLFPSWKEFLVSAAMRLRGEKNFAKAKDVIKLINLSEPDYLKSAEVAENALKTVGWNKLLNDNFKRQEREADLDSLKLSQLIWQLGSNLIYTTNIDDVLEWKSVNDEKIERLDTQTDEFAELQQQENISTPTVVYLHGHISSKANIVFTKTQYEKFYDAHSNEAKLQTLRSFLTRRSFLFLGFSLDDPYFLKQLNYIHDVYKGAASSFYILLPEWEKDNKNIPDYVNIFTFSGFGKPLLEKVQALSDAAKDTTATVKTTPILKTDFDIKKPFFNVPYNSKGNEFVGRKDKTSEIWNLLDTNGCAAIGQAVSVKGFGGLGKTQLAVEYAHEYRDRYENGVFWIVADESIDNQLLQIADKMNWINQYDKTVNQLDVAKAKFLQLSDCLILFDNVETYADIKDYLPKLNRQTHALITSRETVTNFRAINLELLKRDESRTLLLKISKRNLNDDVEKEHLEKILETLGDIPLAIELVGGYLTEHETVTFEKYHQYLDEVPLDQLEKEFPEGSFTNHDRSIIQTLRISEKTIKEKPLMVEILKVLAWSGSSSMGISLLKTLIDAKSEFEFDTALGDAHKLRLLRKDEKDERYAIHRLLAKVIQHENSINNQKEWHKEIALKFEKWFEFREDEFEFLSEFEAEFEHLQAWQKQTVKFCPSEAIYLTVLCSSPAWQRGNYREALMIHIKALDLFKIERIEDDKLLAVLYNGIGLNLDCLGNSQEALEYLQKALEIRRKVFGTKHQDLAHALNNIGVTLNELGNFQLALDYHHEALSMRQSLFSEKHVFIANSFNNLAVTYCGLDNFQEALKFQLSALEMLRELCGEKHPEFAITLNNIGGTYDDLENHSEALRCKLQALKIQKEVFGENHPNICVTLSNIGMSYHYLGNSEVALEYENQSLVMAKELFGEQHLYTASPLNNLGLIYSEIDDKNNAIYYYELSLAIFREFLGEQHYKTIITCWNLICAYSEKGLIERAGKIASEFFKYIPQNHALWNQFEGISRPYRKKKNRHKNRRH